MREMPPIPQSEPEKLPKEKPLEKENSDKRELKTAYEAALERIDGASKTSKQKENKLKTVAELAMEGETELEKQRNEEIARSEKKEEKTSTETELETTSAEVRAEIEKIKRERYGIEDPVVKNLVLNIGKGALNTVGSIFGARLAWEAPKLIYDSFKKKGQREKLSAATYELLKKTQEGKVKKETKQEKENEEKEPKGLVALKIQELNEKLKETKMPAEDKKALRTELAQILREYRQTGKDLEEAKIQKTGKLLDLYINTSAQKMIVAKETVNTLSIATFTPWLRLAGYTALSGAERARKASQNYERKHFREPGSKREKLGFLAKNLTIGAAREAFNGLTFNLFSKEKKGKIETGAKFASSVFMLTRMAGLLEFEHALQAGNLPMQEGAQKFWQNLEKGNLADTLKQGAENWLANAERLLSYVGLAENPHKAITEAVGGKETGSPSEMPKQEILGHVPAEQQTEQPQVATQTEIAVQKQFEHIKELATIKRGEGIEHTLIRQLENEPKTFGFKGDPTNALKLHRWAQREAHLSAIRNHFVNPTTGDETHVLYNSEHPSEYILNPDGSIHAVNQHEYTYNQAQELKKQIEEMAKAKQLALEKIIPTPELTARETMIPETYFFSDDEAIEEAGFCAQDDPVFYEKLSYLLSDKNQLKMERIISYEKFKDFKVGFLFNDQGVRGNSMRILKELPDNRSADKLLAILKNTFNDIKDTTERKTASNLTIEQFLKKYNEN